jgi:hypothetical protein
LHHGRFESCILSSRRWKQIDIAITEAFNEAKDNVKYPFAVVTKSLHKFSDTFSIAIVARTVRHIAPCDVRWFPGLKPV